MGFELEMEYGIPDDVDYEDDEISELDIIDRMDACVCHFADDDNWDNHTPSITGCWCSL